jgi:hypothetical protein
LKHLALGAWVEVRGPSHAPMSRPRIRFTLRPFPPAASRSFGLGSKCLRGLLVSAAGQCAETRCGQDGFVDRRVRILLEVAQEPARSDPAGGGGGPCGRRGRSVRASPRDRVAAGLSLGPVRRARSGLQRPLEDRIWMALRGRRPSSLGACDGGPNSLVSQPLIPTAKPLARSPPPGDYLLTLRAVSCGQASRGRG